MMVVVYCIQKLAPCQALIYMLQNRCCVWEIGDKCANNRIKQGPGCIWRRGWSTREGRPLQGITGTQARSSRSGVAQLFYRCHRHRHHRQHDHHPAFIGRALVFLSHGFSEHLGLYHEVGTFLSELIFNRPKVGWWVGGWFQNDHLKCYPSNSDHHHYYCHPEVMRAFWPLATTMSATGAVVASNLHHHCSHHHPHFRAHLQSYNKMTRCTTR